MKSLFLKSTIVVVFFAPLLVMSQNISVNNGNWATNSVWQSGTSPGFVGVGNTTIDSRVRALSGIGFDAPSGVTLTINDTLIIDGDLAFNPMRNGNSIVMGPDGVLVVFGNVIMGMNGTLINLGSNSVVAVDGNITSTGTGMSGPVDVTGSGGIYTDGTTTLDTSPLSLAQLDIDYPEIGDFVTSGGSSPLPVVLSSFEIFQEGAAVRVAWSTSSERNTEKFEIYRSNGIEDYQVVAEVPAVGNSEVEQHYTYVDRLPFEGDNYYFLRSIDFDGFTESFDVHRLDFQAERLGVFPNPSPDGAFLVRYEDNSEPLLVQVFDLTGRELYRSRFEDGLKEVRTNLPNGQYVMRITGAEIREVERVVIVR